MTRVVLVMVFVRVVETVSPVAGLTVTVVVGSADSVVVVSVSKTFWCPTGGAVSGGAVSSRRPVGFSNDWEKTGGAGAGAGRGSGLYCLITTGACFGCSGARAAAVGVGVATVLTETTFVVLVGAEVGTGVFLWADATLVTDDGG